MRRCGRFSLVVCIAAIASTAGVVASPGGRAVQAPAAVATPSARTWLGKTSEIESYLRTAEVERLEDIGTGVTHPRRAYLRPPGPLDSLVWKVLPPGRRGGYWESYKSEIAAYILDARLGMHMVPPAVERTIGEETGAAVMWLDGVKSVKQTGGKVPSGPIWGRSIRIMLMFDDLIANIDRNAGNILLGAPGELILIDHSRAFGTSRKLVNPLQRVDAKLWEAMRALTADQLNSALGDWLDADQISTMIDRRDDMVKAVDKLVAQKGRAAVIVD
jgi:hypothetical protein